MFTLTFPVIYALELTPLCNHHCPGCGNVFPRSRAPLSASGWRQVLDRIAPYAEVLKLTGGEPTLHPEFAGIIEAIAGKDIPFTLFTHGCWRQSQTVIDLLQATPQCGGLLISLHGHDAATHERFTATPGSFAAVCQNIRRATAAGLRVHTSTVITCYNWNRVREVVALSQTLGARRAVFNRYLGPSMPDLEPDEGQLRQAIRDIEICKRSPVAGHRSANNGQPLTFSVRYGNCIPHCFIPSSAIGCWAGVAYCTIDPWGNLRPCNHSPTIAGNLLAAPLDSLWHNDIMNGWRALLPEPCHTCAAFETCHGGCRALVEIRGQDPLIRLPIQTEPARPPLELELYEQSCPALHGKVQPESFGYALIRGHTIVPVTLQAKPVLDQLNGQTTLQQVRDNFGQEALNFVGSLYQQGLVTLAPER